MYNSAPKHQSVSESIARVRAAVDEAKSELPGETDQLKVEQISAQNVPLLTVDLFGKIDMAVLTRAANEIKELLEKIPNVREVNLGVQREEVIHVQSIASTAIALLVTPSLYLLLTPPIKS